MTDILSPAAVAAMTDRAAQATAGPWELAWDSCDCDNVMGCEHNDFIEGIKAADGKLVLEINYAAYLDLDFIAAARTDLPALAASHEALRAEVERLREEVRLMTIPI